MKPRKVYIGILTVTQRISMQIGYFFCRCMRHGWKEGWQPGVTVFNGLRGYAFARNTVVHKFLKDTDAEWLWFMDDDIQPPEDVERLLDETDNADIIAPIMPTMRFIGSKDGYDMDLPVCACTYENIKDINSIKPVDVTKDRGLVQVDGVGMGCTLIRRKVLEDLRMRNPIVYVRPDNTVHSMTKDEPPAIFQYHRKPNGATDVGEDYDFCYRARQCGYRVALHTGLICGHLKNVDILQIVPYRDFMAESQKRLGNDKKTHSAA